MQVLICEDRQAWSISIHMNMVLLGSQGSCRIWDQLGAMPGPIPYSVMTNGLICAEDVGGLGDT